MPPVNAAPPAIYGRLLCRSFATGYDSQRVTVNLLYLRCHRFKVVTLIGVFCSSGYRALAQIGALSMNRPSSSAQRRQSLTTDQFFYFFLRLRKGEVRRTVQVLQERFPTESPQQLSKRLIESKARLSLLGGTILQVPMLLPGIGQVLKLAGVVGGASMLTRMQLYLILEIALVFGKDIEDQARVAEMAAVVAATGVGVAAPLLVRALEWHPWYALPLGGLSATATTRMIGAAAIRYYGAGSRVARHAVALPPP